jgi:hypothetical protein
LPGERKGLKLEITKINFCSVGNVHHLDVIK